MATNFPFTELDFETYKTNLKNYLKGQDRFSDYDFEGSNIAVLIDIMAYNMFQQGIYNNMAFAEMFLDSAQIRDNAMSHAKELNYVPGSNVSSISKLNLRMTTSSGQNPSSITVPRGTRFRAACGNRLYTYVTDQTLTALPVNGNYTLSNITVYEGTITSELYTVTGAEDQQFVINNEQVDINSIRVYVSENTNPNSTKREFTRQSEIFGVANDDTVFYVSPHFDGKYKVEFGRNLFGEHPVNGNVIEIEYRVTKGSEANGATDFVAVESATGGFPIVVTSSIESINGGDRETLEDIKFFAPKALQVQERAVTKQDYEILLQSRFPNIQAVSVFGGDELDPPQYGRVVISVDVLGSFGAGDAEIREFTNYIRDKTPLTIEPIFIPAKFVYGAVDLYVYYDPRKTTKSQAQIRQDVLNALVAYSEANLNKFNIPLRQSRLSRLVDDLDTSIVSNDMTIDPIIEITPELGVANSPYFSFNTQLKQGYLFDETYSIDGYQPAIISSNFTLAGTNVYLMDNGIGSIMAITSSATNRRVFRRNIGNVNYRTGEVKLSNVTVDAFEGTGIRFRGYTTKNDIDPIIDRILALREKDVNIVVSPARDRR